MPESPIYNQSNNGEGTSTINGIMSYSSRIVKQDEVQYGVNRIINAANKSKANVVKIHVMGSQVKPKIIE